MNDIVEQLLWYPAHARDGDPHVCRIPSSYLIEAAAEIKQLTADRDQWKNLARLSEQDNDAKRAEIKELWDEIERQRVLLREQINKSRDNERAG